MLHDIVTRALAQLTGDSSTQELLKGRFRYAYASDDGQFVAILTHDLTTFVVDLSGRRYCAECGGLPCGFAGHVLEMEDPGERSIPRCVFDLDMDDQALPWRNCPGGEPSLSAAFQREQGRLPVSQR